jgi:phosphoglycerate dehydrogenase-like enzyme
VIASVPFAGLAETAGEVEGVEYVVWDGAEPPPRDDIELVVLDYRNARLTLDRLDLLPALAVVQTQTAGVDGIAEHLPEDVLLANARGVHDDATAELALGLTIASLRGVDRAVRDHGHWPGWTERGGEQRSLADSSVAILGYGSIGRALAARLLACRAVVTAVATAPREDDLVGRVVADADVDWAAQHVVVVVLPLSPTTRHIVDGAFLARLSDGALVVNVGRGPLLDTSAVLAEAGRLRFALDVTDPEPLPDGHPLWSAPGVVITPHVAGGTTAMLPRMGALLRDQLERYVAGEVLKNVVAVGESDG